MKAHPTLIAFALVAACGASIAVDTPEPTPPRATDALATARQHVQAQRWPQALAELRKVNASGSADWNNLMGFTLRKQTPPDLDGAQRHYDAALKIDPRHQGALEYSGELALMKGDLPTAEARLAALARLCSSPCEPLDDLAKSIARYKATGKS